tara:strand:+ start:7887 stop:9098 length:1212 start_codon:yes stop_codon:yes gene_type:complete
LEEPYDSNFIISENRIDIIIGIEYVKAYDRKYKTDFFKELYVTNKRSFNRLREPDWNEGWENRKQKRGKFAFIESFNRLIDSIKELKTNSELIPVYLGDKNEWWISDGMHRASACYGLNLPINAKFYNKPIAKDSRWYYPTNIEFFRKGNRGQLGRRTLTPGMCDVSCNFTMEMFFRKYFRDFSCLVIQLNKTNCKIPSELSTLYRDDILYEHDINFESTDGGLFVNNLNKLLFKKTQNSFENYFNFKIVFLRGDVATELVEVCNNVKSDNDINLYHISENTVDILQLLNNNTIDFLSSVDLSNKINKRFDELKIFCLKHKINTNKICIIGDFVRSLYNETDESDLKLIVDKTYKDVFKKSQFEIDYEETLIHPDDILYNPNNHFYYHNFKCGLAKFINGGEL